MVQFVADLKDLSGKISFVSIVTDRELIAVGGLEDWAWHELVVEAWVEEEEAVVLLSSS